MNTKETKNIYSFNFETKTAYINDEPLGTIVDHSDTAINVVWDNGMKQEFRLWQPVKNFTNFEA
jgi:hypothetical protein